MKIRKSVFCLLVAMIVLLGLLPAPAHAAAAWNGSSTATAFGGGNGTSSSPYQISTPAQLNYLATLLKTNNTYNNNWNNFGSKYYILTADIDMGGHPFTGINYFDGNFNGNGYTISGLNISSENSGMDNYTVGLFGSCSNTTIKNLTVKGNIHGDQSVGGIVGAMSKGSITNCVNYCTIYGYSYAGGILGRSVPNKAAVTVSKCKNYGMVTGGTIGGIIGNIDEENASYTNYTKVEYCANLATVKGYNYVGGIVGNACGGYIQYCANVGAVSCLGTTFYKPYDEENAGGIVGEISSSGSANYYAIGKLQDCYNAGKITSTGYAGGIGARIYGNNGIDREVSTTFKACYNIGAVSGKTAYHLGPTGGYLSVGSLYYLSGTNPSATGGVASELTDAQMRVKSNFAGFSSTAWKVSTTGSYPYPYITNIGELPLSCSHYWGKATCQTPQTCTCCGATQGELGSHSYKNGVCMFCGKDQYHKHGTTRFQEWTSATELPAQSGCYCLTEDITLSAAWTAPAGELTLCLNGHTVSGNYTKTVGADSTLSLGDCAATPGAITVGSSRNLTNISVEEGGTLNISNITVQASTLQSWNDEYSSSVTAITNYGTVNLNSGKIFANTDAFVYRGATTTGVNNSGVFNMYGGTVHAFAESHSSDKSYTSRGIYNSGACNISGGTVLAELGTANTIRNKTAYPMVVSGGSVRFSATPTITGDILVYKPGVIYARNGDTPYTGGTISLHDRERALVGKNYTIVVREVTQNVNDSRFQLFSMTGESQNMTLFNGNLVYDNGENHEHSWTAAACGQTRHCSVCEYSDGEILEHDWTDATCTAPKTCKNCGEAEGEALGHAPEQMVFAVENTTIYASCGICNTELGSMTLTCTNVDYEPQNIYEATVTGQISGIDSYTLEYCCPDGCSQAGPHTAQLTVGTSSVYAYFHINHIQLTITDIQISDKIYDAKSQVKVTEISLGNVADGDDVSVDLTYLVAQAASVNAGTYDKVDLRSVILTGEDSANYTIESVWTGVPVSGGFTVEPHRLTLKALDQQLEIGSQIDQWAFEMAEGTSVVHPDAVNCLTITGDTSEVADSGVLMPSGAQIINWDMEDVTGNYIITYLPGTLTVYCGDHKYESVETPPTCTDGGYTTYTCAACGDSYIGDKVPAHKTENHDAVEATCTEVGYTAGVYCTVCQKYISGHEEVPAHKTENHDAVDATCTEIGYTAGVYCTVCQKYISGHEEVPAHKTENHDAVDATCTTVGYTAGVYCTVCQKYISGHEEVPAHKTENHDAVDATCTTVGYTAGVYCTVCQKYISGHEEVPAHKTENHDAVDATCTTVGYTAGVYCTVCQKYISGHEEVPAHKTENRDAVEATCTEVGYTAGVYCTVCEKYISGHEEVPAHKTENRDAVDATCTEIGYTAGVYCTVCEKYISGHEEVPAQKHDMGQWNIEKAATCTEAGSMNRVCKREGCKYAETEEITAIGHDYKAVVTAPSCTTAGYTTHTCANCGDSFKDSQILATGHTPETDSAVAPSCTAEGKTEGSHCAICGAVIKAQETVPAKGHTSVVDPEVAPTENQPGKTEGSHCSVCGQILKAQTVIPALGHTHTPVTVPGVAPTCTESGKTDGVQCSGCLEILVEQKTIPATDHSPVTDPAVAPTCIQSGKTEGSHCSACGKVFVAQETVPTTGHTPVVDKAQESTCTKPGKTEGSYCSVCGKTITAQQTLPPKGHVYDDNVDGTCNVCGIHREEVEKRIVVHMFRMYNPNTGEHFYTGSEEERDNLIGHGWQYEGVGFTFPANSGAPVYRLFHEPTGEHLYTMDKAEKEKLEAEGWNYEGVAFNSAYNTEAVQYRLHNPNATVGAYHFTFSLVERQNLLDAGWEDQGIGWYSCWK